MNTLPSESTQTPAAPATELVVQADKPVSGVAMPQVDMIHEDTPGLPQSILKSSTSTSLHFPQSPAGNGTTATPAFPKPALVESKTQAPVHSPVVLCSLPKGLAFVGEAHFPCDVQINGTLEGKLTAEPNKTITVSVTGVIKGDLRATNIRIEGKADGAITAEGGLASFGPKSICAGQITYGRLGIEEGADVEATMKKIAAKAI